MREVSNLCLAIFVLFGVISLRIFWGAAITPISRPLRSYAYPVLVVTFVGWIVAILKTNQAGEPVPSRAEQKAEVVAS